MLKAMSEGIYEKEHILAMTLLSAIAGESVFLLGPPGTAKSLVARRLKLAFKDGNAFEYLMSRFSTPDEIFSPVSISLLKNEDKYEPVVDDKGATQHSYHPHFGAASRQTDAGLQPLCPPSSAPSPFIPGYWGLHFI